MRTTSSWCFGTAIILILNSIADCTECGMELSTPAYSALSCETPAETLTCELTCTAGYYFGHPSSGTKLTQTCQTTTGHWSEQTAHNWFAKWPDICMKIDPPIARTTTLITHLVPTVTPASLTCPTNDQINTALTAFKKKHRALLVCIYDDTKICEQKTTETQCEVVSEPVDSLKLTVVYELKSDLSDAQTMKILNNSLVYIIEEGSFSLDIEHTTSRKRATTEVSYQASTEHYSSFVSFTCPSGNGKIGDYCTECPQGYYRVGDACRRCDKGFYTDQEASLTCKQCTNGKTTMLDRSTSEGDCVEVCVVKATARGSESPERGWHVTADTTVSVECKAGHTVPLGQPSSYQCAEDVIECYESCTLQALPDDVMLLADDTVERVLLHGEETTVVCVDFVHYTTLICNDGRLNWPDCESVNFTRLGDHLYFIFLGVVVLGVLVFASFVASRERGRFKGAVQTNIENPLEKRIVSLPLHVDEFSSKVDVYNNGGLSRWQKEFNLIPADDPTQLKSVALTSYNHRKNRVGARGIVPYDISRVKVGKEDNPEADYYNASYINGWSGPRQYIVAQTPLVRNMADFWRILLEQESGIMINLHHSADIENPAEYPKYWPDTEQLHEDILVRLTVETEYQGFVVREFTVGCVELSDTETVVSILHEEEAEEGGDAKEEATQTSFEETANDDDTKSVGGDSAKSLKSVRSSKTVKSTKSIAEPGKYDDYEFSFALKQLHFTDWDEDGIPSLPAFINLLLFYRDISETSTAEAPLALHSGFGSDWCGVFCGADYILNRLISDPTINVAGLTNAMRQQRPMMVATVEQYQYLHNVIDTILRRDDIEDLKSNGFKQAASDFLVGGAPTESEHSETKGSPLASVVAMVQSWKAMTQSIFKINGSSDDESSSDDDDSNV